MPWKEHRIMSLKLEFVQKATAKGANISALCREYGITRQTGHKWLKRYEADGYDGLEERSRRPKSTPLGAAEEIIAAILKAREAHLAGATVLRGPMGFGKSSRLHTAKILRLSMDLPVVIEIVDSDEKIRAFLPVLDGMLGGGLVTMEKVQVIDYRSGNDTRTSPD